MKMKYVFLVVTLHREFVVMNLGTSWLDWLWTGLSWICV